MNWGKAFQRLMHWLPNVWETLALGAALLMLIWLTLRLRSWFRDDAADNDPALDLLADMKELHDEGGLTEEEFRSIKTRLAQAATGVGASRKIPSFAERSLKSKPAGLAETDSTENSLQGCSDPPDRQPIGHEAIDAAEDAPRVDTP